MMLFCVFVLLAAHLAEGSFVGMTCVTSEQCRTSRVMRHTCCVLGSCRCDAGYYGKFEDNHCVNIGIGIPCPGTGGNVFCNSGVTGSVCSPIFNVCACPAGTAEVFSDVPKPFCAARSNDVACALCDSTNGVCFEGEGLTCGCPCQYRTSQPTNSIAVGCDLKYAWTGQPCGESVGCDDPWAECVHDGQLTVEFTCECKTGYVSVQKPTNPLYYTCARRISVTVDPDCATCIRNEGQCFDDNFDNVMDGCLCPIGRTSDSSKPTDACGNNHLSVACTSNDMTVCVKGDASFLQNFALMYAADKAEFLECHFVEVSAGRWCLRLSYAGETCGLWISENTFTKAYSVWLDFQKGAAVSAYDLCMYSYCSYHKIAKTQTGLIDIKTKKLTTAIGYSVKPDIEMTIGNKFEEDVQLTGARLGEMVRLAIRITKDQGVYLTLRAEVCVASNMMVLDHPHAQSAVFILKACPYDDKPLTNPTPIFYLDPADPKRIVTNFFPMPKFSSDVVFFHCAARVCINPVNCAPPSCDGERKKRSLTITSKDGRPVQRSVADLLREYASSPDLTTKTIGVRTRDSSTAAAQHDYMPHRAAEAANVEQIEERILKAMSDAQRKAKKENVQKASGDLMSPEVFIASVVASVLLTLFIGLVIFFVCSVLPSRKAVQKKLKGKVILPKMILLSCFVRFLVMNKNGLKSKRLLKSSLLLWNLVLTA